MNCYRATPSRAATIFGARNLFRFNACWSRDAKSVHLLVGSEACCGQKSECPMTKEARISKFESAREDLFTFGLNFGFRHSFAIRHLDFVIIPSDPRLPTVQFI